MPRPRKLEKGSVTSVFLPESLKKALEAEAAKRGKKVSELIREALTSYLSLQNSSSDPPSAVDPLVEAELADFRDALERLEKSVRELEYRAQPLAKALASGTRVLSSEDYRLKIALSSDTIALKKKWYALRRWYSHLPRDEALSARMAELLRRLQALQKLSC